MNLSLLVCCAFLGHGAGDTPSALPVREITVFKDGHTFVLQEGELPVGAGGDILLDRLPQPVMGTFWPYSAEPGAELIGVVAGSRAVRVDQPALGMADLLRANVGATMTLRERRGESTAELVALFEGSDVLLLRTEVGTRMVPLGNVVDVVIHGEGETTLVREEMRDLLTLDLRWEGTPRKNARVGMAYLQKGFRWIPHYRISMDGEGRALVQLQATLINELVDVEDVTANLVIGAPSFAFEDTLDPIALQATAAQLSQYFQENQQTAYAFSNSLMTQTARMGEYRNVVSHGTGAGAGDEAEGHGGVRNEDHFIFHVPHITLKKGERMIVPVAEFTLPYRDVFTLDVDMVPPPELQQHFNNQQQQELARLFHGPRVMHQLRLENVSPFPLTTAPALIQKGERLIGQGMMTYTPIGCEVDLELTAAIDVPVDKLDEELQRTPSAIKWHGYEYDRVDLSGELRLHNRREVPVLVEIVRHVLGEVDRVEDGGVASKVALFEDDGAARGRGNAFGGWWYYRYNPWNHVNGVGRIEWTVELDPGESLTLEYGWHQFVR